MDVKEMREVAESVSEHTACGCDPSVGVVHCPSCDARYLAKLMLVLTNPDPLTLDAAVQVMGREPDRLTRDEFGERGYWFEKHQYVCDVSTSKHLVRASFLRVSYDNPTIGLFALLAAAARMGGKA